LTFKNLLLASSSRYRRELLARLGLPFDCCSPSVDEGALPREAPRETAARLARVKAAAGRQHAPDSWIIGCDQVAELAGCALGKPGSLENARRQLRAMSGATVRFHTALCLLAPPQGNRSEATETTSVTFRALDDAEIDRYLAREPAIDCAGSAKIEGLGISLIEKLEGDDPSALIGLPLIALARLLRAEGFEVP
jgi:septum formation protein